MRKVFFMKARFAYCCIVFTFISVSLSYSAEDIETLYAQGDLALGMNDYVTSTYYFERIFNSPEWKEFPRKVDVLYKLGILEESQSRFDRAADRYEKLLQVLAESPQDPAFRMYDFYALKYGETLERAGQYERASQLYWILLNNLHALQQQNLLLRIIRNYGFQTISPDEMQKLHSLVIPNYQDSLGFELAELYRIQQKPEQSLALYEQLWSNQLAQANEYAGGMVEVYTAQGKLDGLIQRLRQLREEGNDPITALRLELKLLSQSDQGEEALQALETFAKRHNWLQSGPANLVERVPIELLDQWVNLLEQYRSPEEAIAIMKGIVKLLPMDVHRRTRLSDMLRNHAQHEEAVQLWIDWAKTSIGNPLVILNAVDHLQKLNADDAATALLQEMQGQIPPALSMKQGEILLQLKDYPGALKIFHTATSTGGVPPDTITQTITEYAKSKQNVVPLVAGLLYSATSQPFQEVPIWVRDSLLQLSVHHGMIDVLTTLGDQDASGVWKYHIAAQAIRTGRKNWGMKMLKSIPANSLYRSAADRELASLLENRTDISSQRQAADLIRPSVANVLDTTEAVPLNYSLVENLIRYAELRLNAYQPGEALAAVREIEAASHTLPSPLLPDFNDRLKLARARSLIELGSFQAAVSILDSIDFQPYKTEAKYLLARVHLALKSRDIAQSVLTEIVENQEHWQRGNDAIALISALEPLVGDALENFYLVQLYTLQGRFEDTVPILRQIAVSHYGEDTEEWARYTIGDLLMKSGKTEDAIAEWERLQIDVDHPVIHGMLRYSMLQENILSEDRIVDSTDYQNLMIDFPDTLFSDLVRLEYQALRNKENP